MGWPTPRREGRRYVLRVPRDLPALALPSLVRVKQVHVLKQHVLHRRPREDLKLAALRLHHVHRDVAECQPPDHGGVAAHQDAVVAAALLVLVVYSLVLVLRCIRMMMTAEGLPKEE